MSEKVLECINELRLRLDRSLIARGEFSDKGLYSLTLPLKLDLIPHLSNPGKPFLLWGRPDRQHYRIGLGIVKQLTASGAERLQDLQLGFQRLTNGWKHDCENTDHAHPGAFCAFAFDDKDEMTGPWQDVPNSLILIPELLLEFKEGRYSLSFTCENPGLEKFKWLKNHWLKQAVKLLQAIAGSPKNIPASNTLFRSPDKTDKINWCRQVDAVRKAITQGKLDKVVPVRHVFVRNSVPFDISAVFNHLIHHHSSSLVIGMSLGDKTLAAATPETLVALDNGTLSCDALGGTEKRLKDFRQDNLLAHKLLQDTKSRHEHQLIVQHLTSVLGKFSSHLSVADTPSVMPLGQLQHLWTPIKAQCRPGISLFDIAKKLHPTPAVAGTPVAAAKRWIKNNESFQRGWYTGSVGWLEKDGNGELAVLLRCALLSDSSADLYAGAGIVGDSDPLSEWDETELKLKTMLYALGETMPDLSGQSSAEFSGLHPVYSAFKSNGHA